MNFKTVFPIWELAKNKVEKSGVFFAPEKEASPHHVSAHIHHTITIKKPR
jgi:hypothetical protein